MSVGWESLPLLPLRCVLQHLSLEDAMSAMTVCQHWRNAILVYEGHRDTMKLRTKQTEKNLFLARLFRKNVRKLHIFIDCVDGELDKFFNIVLPEFFDAVKLKEILFIGPSYLQQNHNLPPTKLRRIVTESLIFKNSHCIVKFGIIGCEIDIAVDNDRYMHEQIEYYSTPLSFNEVQTEADRVLSSTNASLMLFSTLQHIIVDYDSISTEALVTLSQLPMFQHLSLMITNKRPLRPLGWERLRNLYPNGLDVSVNLIALPYRRFAEVIAYVLVEGMALVSLKVIFCNTMYWPLVAHVARAHQSTLREVVWADGPRAARAGEPRRPPPAAAEMDALNINPFILLCWQCKNLRRLVIHGYWIWEYDILGFVRLRKTFQELELSAIYSKQGRFRGVDLNPTVAVRVLAVDTPITVNEQFVQQVNEVTEFPWRPVAWDALPRGLQRAASPAQRQRYVLREILRPV